MVTFYTDNFYRYYGKRVCDLGISITMLIFLSPLLLGIALLVRLKIGSPVIFRQQRPGFHSRPFILYKFRTMTNACDADGNLLPDTERLTVLGRFLRSTSLDELPELFNVLKGDMSMVGPRPLLMGYLPYYTQRESLRHSVRPGLTGLAQVSGRNVLSWDERLELDVQYIEQISLFKDIVILWKTLWKVIKREDVIVIPGVVQGTLIQCRQTKIEVKVDEIAG